MCTVDFKDVENNRCLCWEEDRKFGLVFTTKVTRSVNCKKTADLRFRDDDDLRLRDDDVQYVLLSILSEICMQCIVFPARSSHSFHKAGSHTECHIKNDNFCFQFGDKFLIPRVPAPPLYIFMSKENPDFEIRNIIKASWVPKNIFPVKHSNYQSLDMRTTH